MIRNVLYFTRSRFQVRSVAFVLLSVVGMTHFVSAPAVMAQSAINDYLETRVQELSESTRKDIEAVTPENWDETQQQWRDELRTMLGIPANLEKTALETKMVGELQLNGARIQRLHYQARPGLYVAANLYLPTTEKPETGFPAVLYVCGHSRVVNQGRLMGNKTNYQHHGLWLARHGFVCLMIDTIQWGEFHGEHHGTYRLGRWDWHSRGYTPAGVEAWNAIRGVDLLSDHPLVDAKRIGITGRSGGGAYSWFAAALDTRIRCAIPVAGITDLQDHVLQGAVEGHCDCMYFVNYFGWDYAKLAALIAPRALLLENSDSDWIFPLGGVVRIDRQLRTLYQNLGAEDQYGLVITPGPHKDTQDLRVPAFRFLLKHLKGESDPVYDAPAIKEVDPTQLAVFEREIPRNEKVTTAAAWFAPAPKPTPADSELSIDEASKKWKNAFPDLQRLGVLPTEIPTTQFQRYTSAQSEPSEWESDSGIKVTQIKGAQSEEKQNNDPDSSVAMVHLILDTTQWSPGKIQQRAQRWPHSMHYFVQWRGAHWKETKQNDIRGQRHLARRFYLLGATLEEVALWDFLTTLKWITEEQSGANLQIAAAGREVTIATLAALVADSDLLPIDGITKLWLDDVPTDLKHSASLPGLFQVLTPDTLVGAAQKASAVERLSFEDHPSTRFIDTASLPQQANGLRIVEVGQNSAQVWVRATRRELPNLADLPDVTFTEPHGKQSYGAILPPGGVDNLRFAVPGVSAEVRVGVGGSGIDGFRYSDWQRVEGDTDFSALIPLQELRPNTSYSVRAQVRAAVAPDMASTTDGQTQRPLSTRPISTRPISTMGGAFKTLPATDAPASFKLAVGTCQAFVDRDGPHGFDVYRTISNRKTDAFVLAGDVVYYDRLARSKELAYYHWQRTYSLPTLIEFHRRMPTFFLKDDHDTYVNDSWPGQHKEWTEDFRFVDGQEIFRQQTGLPTPAYRTFKVGSDLQVWLMEGRDYRSANNMPDGPEKTIWGTEQKAWLERTLGKSTADFKVVISPTPVVGPDRENKHDNHSNQDFASEGKQIRKMLADTPNTVVVCGDRHWQFHSVDPETGLHEFSVGPVSDRHAGGWKQSDFRPEIHKYLRVGGGYLEIESRGSTEDRKLILRHLDTTGKEHHRHVLSSQSE